VIKSKLRSKVIKLRKSYFEKSININAKGIYSILKKRNYNFKTVGGYYPSNYEIDDLDILNFFSKKGSVIGFPKIKKNSQMDFFKWNKDNPLLINKYGIPEPNTSNKIFPDVLFIPLVAFDKKLNRLGYGGGFYDRYIDKISKIKKIFKIGLAFSSQELKNIPVSKHDKKLDIIVTEKDIIQ
tara:strand:+ start:775 stop:1320 length:546 start_codon:yes stop_codon:yes gene_type:complete